MPTFLKTLLLLLILVAPLSVEAALITYDLSGPMDRFQATTNSGNAGIGTGSISGTYDPSTNILAWTINFTDLTSSVTNMHFHKGAVGEAVGIEVGIPATPWTSPIVAADPVAIR